METSTNIQGKHSMCDGLHTGLGSEITIDLINRLIIADANVWNCRDRAVSKDYHRTH